MQAFEMILDVLIIVALFGFVGAIVWIVMEGLKLKNQALSTYKRLAAPPIERVKNITATGKGIVQQESIRVRHIGKSIHRASVAVKETADDVIVVVDSLKDTDIEPLLQHAQTAFKFATAAASLLKAASQQGTREAS